jgi:transposase
MGRKSTYTQEYQDNAVKRVVADGNSVIVVARQLGLQAAMLRSWVQKYKTEVKVAKENTKESYIEELRDLRKENEELREANEILKKAAAYFAKNL